MVAVLGVGRIGGIHARNIVRQPGARLTIVSEVDAKAAANELGAKACTHKFVRSALPSEVDVTY